MKTLKERGLFLKGNGLLKDKRLDIKYRKDGRVNVVVLDKSMNKIKDLVIGMKVGNISLYKVGEINLDYNLDDVKFIDMESFILSSKISKETVREEVLNIVNMVIKNKKEHIEIVIVDLDIEVKSI
jgi:hypothetical protein